MNKTIFTQKLSEIYNVPLDFIVKKRHGKTPEITFKLLSELIYELNTIAKVAQELKVSEKTLRKALDTAYPDLNTGNKGTVWRVELLAKLGYRRCNSCHEDKSLEDFYNATGVKENKSYWCKKCSKDLNKIQRLEKPEIIKSSNRKRKAIVKKALDNEANLELIKKIYKECPLGYHVDHIIPIAKGGKHHENNLCYLPATLNMQKQAKLPEEVPLIMQYAIYPELPQ